MSGSSTLIVNLLRTGNVDIVNGNLKLILGLIWSLIVRYQIGKSKFPPRKLMLAWLKVGIRNCTGDLALSCLLFPRNK